MDQAQTPRDREDAIDHAADAPLDVLVIGGGITGVGIALDAVLRGYRVALVERDDLASGTSSKSSKLVHGGVRYLANADLAMVAEGVRERDRTRRMAPHLVRPLGFVVPVDSAADRLKLKVGMTLYDGLAAGRSVRRHRHLDASEVLAVAPGLRNRAGGGAYRYYDAQTDDARLTLAIAQAARSRGADVINHAEVVDLLSADGRVVGAVVRDRVDGNEVELRARWVVSATGVWAGALWNLTPGGAATEVVASKGTHVVLPRTSLAVNQALVVPSGAADGRMNFVIPWGEQVYIGTTDDVFGGDLDHPTLERVDADYLLHSVNEAFGTSLAPADCIGAWAGLRPLLRDKAGDRATKDLSRRHTIVEAPEGLLTITGGKLTTWRQMAEDLVDRIAAEDGNLAGCSTTSIHLGASGSAEAGLARARQAMDQTGIDTALTASLYHRHGDRCDEVARFCVEHGEAERLVPTLPYLAGEVRWSVRHELARTLDDVLSRRLRVALRHAGAGGVGIARAAGICADELAWDDQRRTVEITTYLSGVRAERGPVPLADPRVPG